MKSKTKPPLYRLTVDAAVFWSVHDRFLKRPTIAIKRPDGKIDVAISYNTLDQLKTHALPKENLSDTLQRIYPPIESKPA